MAAWVEMCQAALQRCLPGHNRSTTLNNLAISRHDRFKQRGVPSDLDEAIELFRAALLICPPGHYFRPTSLNNLGLSLHDRFKQRGAPSDLDEAIELQRATLLIYCLNNLGLSLYDRFKQQGVPSDLDEIIELQRAALFICPPGHSLRPTSLNNLGMGLYDRFKQRGVPSDLDEAIEFQQATLLICPPGHSLRPTSLNNLSIGLYERFKQRGVPSDLDEAIELFRAALLICPPGHIGRPTSLNNLGTSLHNRFKQRGLPSDLDEAIELQRATLLICTPDHSLRSTCLNNLGISLYDRFKQRGVPSDLDEAIELQEAALLICPPGHPDRPTSLNNLSASLYDRFEQRGVPSDLDEAIELQRATLLICPPGHFGRPTSLNNLGLSLYDRFKQRGVPSDLDEAIELQRATLLICPPGHSLRPTCLNNLGMGLHDRFTQRGVPSDLDEAIELQEAALLICPPGHPDRPTSLNNLSASLYERFEQRGVPSDLDEAIELQQATLLICLPGHLLRPTYLNNLGTSLYDRFMQRGVPSDLDEAIELHRAALLLYPPGHSDRSLSLNKLALCLRNRFEQRGVPSDLDEAFRLYAQLSHIAHAVSRMDLTAAKSWATSAEETNHDSVLLAYQTALKFLDQHVTILSSSPLHFDIVSMATTSLGMDAFSCSVRHGALTTAVEMVEQGRAVFWTHLARFRTPLDELSMSGDSGAALAEEIKQLSFRLRNAFDRSTEDPSPQIRQLTMQWEDVISRIRMLPDFPRFLLPPLFSDLQKSAEEGPVVIVNASQYSCDALIILSDQDPVHVPLHITQTGVSELSSEFQSLSEQFGSSNHLYKLANILRKLWHEVVDSVVQALKESQVHPGSRIWWCPTADFTLLPLHAAGPYEKKKDNLSDIYVSSYTPTLATLVRARQQVSGDASPQHFVAIGQGNSKGAKALEHVAPELAVVARRLAPVVLVTSLADGDATVQGALDALNHNQWLHLACHGMPNRQQPFESSFAMRDGPLMIKDVIRSNWQNPEFAFLSACHTTVGGEKSPDESIHLAAAMQFSGFRSVIGSMWSVDDEVARQVVSAFYRNLVNGSGRLDCTRAAVALHKAVKSLRKKIPLEQQIVFVHIGV
ncbi:CHAT domain-containing protein [Suillus clintonianus]|uniref:CHAT domain-containing protein n=1 Tax=Suillus clintonianus TaxID=1904413 RepID=UPI001B8837AB|nr:CHAT domain-containing protein [Suillus clintonianus]KAG2128271.1 CHAT domain-containing protein [Suillus clintonianus]